MRLPALALTAINCRNSRWDQIPERRPKSGLNFAVTNNVHIESIASTTTYCAHKTIYTSYSAFLTEGICACYTYT